jgi:transposase
MASDTTAPDEARARYVTGLTQLSRFRQIDQRIAVRFASRTDSDRCGMSGKSPVTANGEQRAALAVLATSRDRGEADRARAVLLTLSGWTSPRIAEAFGVREDTVRLWRGDFARGGVDALKARIAPGPEPVKSTVALRVVTPLLEEPVADRKNWTIARLRAEIETREGVRISRSQLSKALRKKVSVAAAPAHAEGTPDRHRSGPDRFAFATSQASGGSWRYRSSLR